MFPIIVWDSVVSSLSDEASTANAFLALKAYRVAKKIVSYYTLCIIFTKYRPIFTIFSPVDSVKNLLLSGMCITPTCYVATLPCKI